MDTSGKHYTACFWEVDPALLDNMDLCKQAIITACQVADCQILNIFCHKFEPQGLSITATLSTSHCAIHTWPEKGYCAIDLYGCGPEASLGKGIKFLTQTFKPGYCQIDMKSRGVRHDQEII